MSTGITGLIGGIAGLIGALLGATAVLIKTRLDHRHEEVLEHIKSHLALQTNVSTELRAAISDVGREMMSLQHSMEWVCWLAQMDQDMTDEDISSIYSKEVHECIPKLLGYLAVVASLDKSLYEQLMALAQKLWELDEYIASAFVRYRESPTELSRVLKTSYPQSVELYRLLLAELAEIMRFYDRPSTE
jgi:hypothetical protein